MGRWFNAISAKNAKLASSRKPPPILGVSQDTSSPCTSAPGRLLPHAHRRKPALLPSVSFLLYAVQYPIQESIATGQCAPLLSLCRFHLRLDQDYTAGRGITFVTSGFGLLARVTLYLKGKKKPLSDCFSAT